MPKHPGIVKLEHLSGNDALLDNVDTQPSTLVIRASSSACEANHIFKSIGCR